MKDKITCFKLNWYDCGLCSAEYAVQEEITIYRKDGYMVSKELNGYGVICSCEIIRIDQGKVNEFFDFLENISDEWESDYKVPVCDGSEWKVRMWHSSRKVKTFCGTVEYPPNGRDIEEYISSFILCGKSTVSSRPGSMINFCSSIYKP